MVLLVRSGRIRRNGIRVPVTGNMGDVLYGWVEMRGIVEILFVKIHIAAVVCLSVSNDPMCFDCLLRHRVMSIIETQEPSKVCAGRCFVGTGEFVGRFQYVNGRVERFEVVGSLFRTWT